MPHAGSRRVRQARPLLTGLLRFLLYRRWETGSWPATCATGHWSGFGLTEKSSLTDLRERCVAGRQRRDRVAGTTGILRRLLGTTGRQMGRGRPAHHLTGTRSGRLRRGLGMALRRPHRHATSPLTHGTLHRLSDPRQHPHHMDDPTSDLPTDGPPARHRTTALRTRLQASAVRLIQGERGHCQPSAGTEVSSIYRDRTAPSRPTELQLSLLVQGGSLRSPRAARPPAGPALLSPPRSSPAGARAALRACSHLSQRTGTSWLGRSAPRL